MQYHPEFSLGELAVILARRTDMLIDEGFCANVDDALAYVDALDRLHGRPDRADLAWRLGVDREVLEPVRRTREISNFVTFLAKPEASRRGRA